MVIKKEKREKVDSLIEQLWKHGYLTLSRKYGKYLPAPAPVGNYDVDAIAKYKKKIAIGITVTEEELNDPNLITKLIYLTRSKPKHSANKVTLFVGVPYDSIIKANLLLSSLDDETRSRIKLITLQDANEKPELG
jgi:hypothetical protein